MATGGNHRAVASATVTVMFTDIVGSTELIDSLGDDAAERARRTHYGLLRAALEACNGEEVKNTGDGMMAVFTSAQDAVRCAITIERAVERHGRHFRPALEVRIGLHVGEAIRDEGDYFGATVNIARRLCDRALPRQIVASSVVQAVLGRRDESDFTELGPLALKGFSEPVDAVEVNWVADEIDDRSLPAALTGQERLAFVGRRSELKALEQAWTDAANAGPRMFALGGEPGIGKSRMAKEFAISVRDQGALLLFGRCDREPLVPYQPFVEVLRQLLQAIPAQRLVGLPAGTIATLSRLVPELGAGEGSRTDPTMDRYLLFEAVRALLVRVAADAPVLLLFEDVQWADPPTLLLINHLLVDSERMRVLLLATYRDTDADLGAPLADLLAKLRGRDRLASLSLTGLSRLDVAEMIEASARGELGDAPAVLADVVLARTEGNPLFVRELLRDALESGDNGILDDDDHLPEGLRSIIDRRIGRLTPATTAVLTVAAVSGYQFEVEVVTRACGVERGAVLDALDEALAAREVSEAPATPGAFVFNHELVRRAFYAALPTGRRAQLHRRVGEALESLRGDDNAWLSSLAYHYFEGAAAGDAAKAVAFSELAARRALRSFAYEEAVTQYRRALGAARGVDADTERSARLLIGLGRALTYTDEAAVAPGTFREAADAALRAGSAELIALAALGLGQPGPAVTVADPALVGLLERAATGLDANPGLRAQVLARLAREVFGGGERDRADRLSAEALDAARQSEEPVALGVALNARSQCLEGLENLERRVEIDREILLLSDRAGDRELALTAWASLVVGHARLGDIPAVDADLAAFEALSQQVRHSPRIDWYLLTYRTMRSAFAGRMDEAERLADEALVAGERAGVRDASVNHAAQICTIRREQGRLGELGPIVSAFAADPNGMLAWRPLLALVHLEVGARVEAAAVVNTIDPQALRDLPQDDFWLLTLTLASEAVAELGDAERAAVLYELLLPASGYNVVIGGGVVALGSADSYLGRLANVLGHADDSDRHFEAARRHNAEMGAVTAGVRGSLDWGRARLARGDRQGATALAEDASAIAEGTGLSAARELARRLRADAQPEA